MKRQHANDAKAEKGSAMIISVLVTAIMSLLGISYLLMADTENKIAENEKLSAQALYFGEGTVREVKRWFDRPPYDTVLGLLNLVQPTTGVMNRTLRMIDADGPGPTAAVAADGTAGKPYYKVGVDNDGNGHEDIFEKPYRTAWKDMLVGTEAGPDIRIDRGANAATATFLDDLRDKIAPAFPASAAGMLARVKTIDIYAPPYLNVAGAWTRYGMATVKATVEIVKTPVGGPSQVVATRVVKAVLNETPYPGPFGPLHSCDTLNWNGNFHVHWGTSTAVGDADPKKGKLPDSIPRDVPPSAGIDLLHGWQSPAQDAVWTALKNGLEGKAIEDPWWRLVIGGVDQDFPGVMTQQIVAPSANSPDGSNVFHRMDPVVPCPEFDYDTWKMIAQSGGPDVHYYAWDNGTSFSENGTGPVTDFRTLTDNKTGLYFFDTMDGNAPNGAGTNLTPEIDLNGGSYLAKGFVYVNTTEWRTTGLGGRSVDMIWPGEPFRDSNQNGVYDAGEAWINLNYTGISTTNPSTAPVAAKNDLYDPTGIGGGLPVRNQYGPLITGQTASLWGVLYVAGDLDAKGNANYYGSVVSKGGTASKMAGNPDLWWDARIKDNWPPPGWELPRVIITRWETDL